jgi:hypothetical protein
LPQASAPRRAASGRVAPLLFTVLLGVAGCGGATASVRFEVCGPPAFNGGLPVLLVARATDRIEHQEESYFAAAQRAGRADPARLHMSSLLPPRQGPLRRRIRLAVPRNKALGLYFLFAEPYGSWKVLFEPPLGRKVQVELEPHGVRRTAR